MKQKKRLAALVTVISVTAAAFPSGMMCSTASAAGNKVTINEVCTQNKKCLSDGYGEYSDWIELYNSGTSASDLSGYGLTDDTAEPMKFTFPNGTSIAPNEHLIVFASKKESLANELHCGFALSKNGETLMLTAPDGSSQTVEVPTLGEDMTYGASPDGSSTYEIMSPSPAKANAAVLSAPQFSADSGFYSSEFSLSISSPSDTQIYYTTDGSDPTSSSTAQVYSSPIRIQDRTNQPNIYSNYEENNTSQSVSCGINYRKPSYNVDKAEVVRAAAKDRNGNFSAVSDRVYFVTNGNLSQYKDMTVVSLVTDPDNLFDPDKGIYVTGTQYTNWRNSSAYDPMKSVWDTDNKTNYFSRGSEWEREASITVFEKGQAAVIQNMGIRIKGASTRNHAQKSFNLYARSEYGASKVNYPLFPDNYSKDGKLIDKYDSFSLRSASSEERLRDGLAQSLLSDREGITTQNYKPCVVFLDGEYWGLYIMTEKLSDYFIEENYGIDKNDVAMIKNNEPEEGPDEECQAFLDFADRYSQLDLTNESNYRAVCDYIDIDSMIDHYAAGLYLGTYDWPNKNYGVWRNMGEPTEGNRYSDGKWRFMTFDCDYTMGVTYENFGGVEGYAYNSFEHMSSQLKYPPTNLFRALLRNDEFRSRFAAVYCDYANEVFSEKNTSPTIDFYSQNYADIYAPSQLRWWGFYGGSPSSLIPYYKNDYQSKSLGGIRTFFNKRAEYTLPHMKNYLGLSGSLQSVTLRSQGGGKIMINSITPDTVSGAWTGKYYSDCPVTLTAIPDSGHSFSGWGGDADGSQTTITVSLSKALSITASFEESKEIKGDVNADGKVSAADAVVLQKWLLCKSDELAGAENADMNNDGMIDIFDLNAVKKAVIG